LFQLFFILKNLLQIGLYLSLNVPRAFPGGALSSWGNEIVSRPSHLRAPAARLLSVPFLRLMGIIRTEHIVFRLKSANPHGFPRKTFIFSVTHDASLSYVFAPAFRVFVTFL